MALWSDEDVKARGLRERATEVRRGSSPGGKAAVRLLSLAATILVLALVSGTIYGLAAGTRARKLGREADRAAIAAELKGRASYTLIGTLRARSADPKPAVIVATIAFPYDSGDFPFAEELERKAAVLKAAAVALLSSRKAAELAPAFEGAVKAGLRDTFNARLSLGKVTEVWLSDFAVIQ